MLSTNDPTAQSTNHAHGRRLVHSFSPRPLPRPIDPALMRHAEERAKDAQKQNRVADRINVFAESMTFVYIDVAWFGPWIVQKYPFGLLIVSLEAISSRRS